MSNLIPVTDDSNPVSEENSSLVGGEYEGLFRPETPQELPVEQALADPQPPDGDQPASETGRIFRSQGVLGHDDALIAIPLQKSGRLRTLTRDSQRESIGVLDAEIALPPATANVPGIAMHAPAPIPSPRTSSREERKPTSGSRSELVGSLSAPWVYLIAISVTLVFGLGNVLIFGGAAWLTRRNWVTSRHTFSQVSPCGPATISTLSMHRQFHFSSWQPRSGRSTSQIHR